MHLPRKFLAIFFGILLLLVPSLSSVLPTQAYAQTSTSLNTLLPTEGNVQLNIGTLTQGVTLGLISSLTCILGGIDYATSNHQCLSYNSHTGKYVYAGSVGGGVLGLEAGGVAMLYNSPFHTSDYIHYLSSNFGLVKKAEAASSTGFGQLAPITNLWLAFRNLSYLLFVVIFVVIGFAIMLRAKIDPRTVMTIENQLPKLIVALLLITFSYAIAGVMIDIMWVLIFLVINLFASLDPVIRGQIGDMTSAVTKDPYSWVNTLNNGFGGFLGIAGQASGGVKEIANVIASNIFQNVGWLKWILALTVGIPVTLSCIFGAFASGILNAASNTPLLGFFVSAATGGSGQNSPQNFGACIDGGLATEFSTIIAGIAFLIFALALVIAIGKLWWQLLKSYSLFIIYVVFGPLMIMGGVFPGSKVNFEDWIRHLAAYLFVFPTSIGIFLLGKVFMDVYAQHQGIVPPLLGIDPKVTSFMGPVLGFTLIMLAPQALTIVQDSLNAPDLKYLAGVGQALGAGAQGIGGAFGKVTDRAWRAADPLHNLDEGWLRKIVLPKNTRWRQFILGRETNTGIQPNKLGGGSH